MKDTYIVDGYNLLFANDMLSKLASESLEDARDSLLRQLEEFSSYNKLRVIVVFDAHRTKGGQGSRGEFGPLTVIYTSEKETADTLIGSLVKEFLSLGRVYVVTSDWEQQKIIFGHGALRVSGREFWLQLKQTKISIEKDRGSGQYIRQEIGDRLDQNTRDILEKWRRK